VGPVERAENLARHPATVVGPQVDHGDVRSWAINRRAGIDPGKTLKGRGNTTIGINAEAQPSESNRAWFRACQKSALIRPAAPPIAEPRPTVAGPAFTRTGIENQHSLRDAVSQVFNQPRR